MGRPSSPKLTRERIVTTALRLIDARGEEAFSIAQIARALGVKSASLYNHISSKYEIVEGIRELVAGSIDASLFANKPWYEAMEQWAFSYRAAFARHPNTIKLLSVIPVSSKDTLRMYDAVFQGMLRDGWPKTHILPAVTDAESFVLGSAIDLVAPPQMIAAEQLVGDSPVFLEIVQSGYIDGSTRAERAFRVGLAALITGLRDYLASLTPENEVPG